VIIPGSHRDVAPLLLLALVVTTDRKIMSGSVSVPVRSDAAKLMGVFNGVDIECPAASVEYSRVTRSSVPRGAVKIAAGVAQNGGDSVAAVARSEPRTARVAWPLTARRGCRDCCVATNCTPPLGTAVLGASATTTTANVTLLVGEMVEASAATPTVR